MATQAVTTDTFERTVLDNDIVFVDFWAEWCGPCRQFAPIFEKASEANPDIVFAKVDTDANQPLSQALQISSIPTIMAFREGIGVFAQPGAMPGPAFEDIIRQVRELDMDQVRKDIAAQQAGEGGAPQG